MDPLTLAMIIPMVLDIIGFKGNFEDLGVSMQNQIQSMANTLMNKWNEEKQDLFAAPSSSSSQVKPNYEWAKKQIYQNMSNEYYKFQRDLEKAKANDEKSARNNIVTNIGGNVVAKVADVFGMGGKLRDKQAKWIYKDTHRVTNDFAHKYKQSKDQLNKIDNKVINSHRQNINNTRGNTNEKKI